MSFTFFSILDRHKEALEVFEDPIKTVKDLSSTAIEINPSSFTPNVELKQSRYTNLWKCRLHIKWPFKATYTGKSPDVDIAVLYAHIDACLMFQVNKFMILRWFHGQLHKYMY